MMNDLVVNLPQCFGRREGGKEEETLKDVDNKGERMKVAKNGFFGSEGGFSKGKSENNICLYLLELVRYIIRGYIIRSIISP